MQLMLPLFPAHTELITPILGVLKKDSIVTYLLCGSPIYSHAEENYKAFRYITSMLILQGVCRKIDISSCFKVSYDSVKRYVRILEGKQEEGFFGADNRKGSCYKLLPTVIERIQGQLDRGKSNSEIAAQEGVTEGTIRYALKKGKLKKKQIIAVKGAIEPNGV